MKIIYRKKHQNQRDIADKVNELRRSEDNNQTPKKEFGSNLSNFENEAEGEKSNGNSYFPLSWQNIINGLSPTQRDALIQYMRRNVVRFS